ncbi:MAG: beta/gamma crystallin family protein, partial [Betaproteobacteria bacterium]|nr:beta/gamma crystallin family protein [Betaproteobacteria bacterium]
MPIKHILAALGLLLATPATHAQVTFYSQEGFTGRVYVVGGAVPDFSGTGFNDRASSVIVDRGRWELCEHAGYQGRCVLLQRGQYPSLASMGINNQVS